MDTSIIHHILVKITCEHLLMFNTNNIKYRDVKQNTKSAKFTRYFPSFSHQRQLHWIVYVSKLHLKSCKIIFSIKFNEFWCSLWWYCIDWWWKWCSKCSDCTEPRDIKSDHEHGENVSWSDGKALELKLPTLTLHYFINILRPCGNDDFLQARLAKLIPDRAILMEYVTLSGILQPEHCLSLYLA